jgi:hypothetical protein
MAVVEDMDAPAVVAGAPAGMSNDFRRAEPGLDPIVVDVDAEAAADQSRRRGS